MAARSVGSPFSCLALLLLTALAACSDDGDGDNSPADATSDTVSGDASGTDDADEVGEADTDVEADTDEGDDERDEAPTSCSNDSECPDRHDCVDGECRRRCGFDVECDDLNPCTADDCVSGYCVSTVIEPPPEIGDTERGDCRRDVCLDGVLQTVPALDDVPADDGIFCTVARCAGQFPQHVPDHSLCDDGDPTNGAEHCSVASRGCVSGDQPPWYCEEPLPGWGPVEICGDGQDNDGNGLADEGCPCEFGSAQRCYTGPPSTRTSGGCLDGYQRCIDRANPRWGDCEGQILPQAELCDLKDNSCNGCVDDIEDCDPLLTCPTEDFARPLRYYPVDAGAIFDIVGTPVDRVIWRVTPPANSGTTGVEQQGEIQTRVYLDVSGDYQISLELQTDKGTFGCSWVVHAAGSGLRVEMRWDTFGSVDMDLHLHRSGSTRGFCTDDDCYYANCTVGRFGGGVGWGYPASPASECDADGAPCNNPRLDIDNVRGFDPENINIDNPNHGDTFRIMAHMFSGSPTTNPVVSVYCGGRLRAVLGEPPDAVGLTTSGGGCQGQTWRVADVTMIVDPGTGVTDCVVDVLAGADGGWDVRLNSAAY